MGSAIFVDTSGLYAALIKNDQMHRKAEAFLSGAAQARTRFVTTDYVLDETATLLKARGHAHQATVLIEVIFSSTACQVEWMDWERFERTLRFFNKHQDKAWSFTDCFSFLLMKERKISEALTKDEHYRQAGFRPLLV
jgi:predicted nucleic acid-binding protein